MKTVKILIADDHIIVRDGLRSLIESQPGWMVVGEAITGREAVSMAAQCHPDIVIMDFTLPELNGLEATQQIRNISPDSEILIFTMHDSDALAHRLLSVGARAFILKSDGKSHLLAALHALAEHQPYFTPKISNMVLQVFLGTGPVSDASNQTLDRLTVREREIIQLIAEGKTTKEIASLLSLSDKTIEVHRSNLMNKLHLHSIAEIVRYAIRNQIIQA